MDSTTEFKIKALEAERKKLTTYTAYKDPKNAKRVDAINKEMSALIKASKDDNAPKNALANPPEASGYNLTSTSTGPKTIKELETQRDSLIKYSNEFGGEVAKRNAPAIEGINAQLKKMNAQATSNPASYALPGQGGDRQALETERDILFRDIEATSDPALIAKYTARIDQINTDIREKYFSGANAPTTTRQVASTNPSDPYADTGPSGVASFGFKNTSGDVSAKEQQIDKLQALAKANKDNASEAGFIQQIGELAKEVAQLTVKSDPKKSEIYTNLVNDALSGNKGNSSYIYADPYDYGDTLDQAYGQVFNSEREFTAAEAQQAKVKEEQRVMAERLAAIGIATAAIPAIIMSGAGPAALLNPAAYGAGAAGAGVTGAAATAAGAPAASAPLVVPGMAGAAGTSAGAGLAAGATAAGATGAAAGGAAAVPAAAGGAAAGAAGAGVAEAAGAAAANGLFGGLDAAAIASLLSAGYGAYTANEAGKAQAEAARYAADKGYTASQDALKLLKDQYDAGMARDKAIYDQQRGDTQAWRTAGEQALPKLNTFEQDNPVYKPDPFKFETTGANADPSYNFRLNEGMKALQASAAAKGMLRSGNTLQGITDYAQGAASQEYSNAFSRYQADTMNKYNMSNANRGQNLNRLQSLAGIGQTAVGQLGNAGQNYGSSANQAGQSYANNAGNLMASGANAQGQGAMGAASGNASGAIGASNALTNALSGYLQYNSRSQMNNRTYGGY